MRRILERAGAVGWALNDLCIMTWIRELPCSVGNQQAKPSRAVRQPIVEYFLPLWFLASRYVTFRCVSAVGLDELTDLRVVKTG